MKIRRVKELNTVDIKLLTAGVSYVSLFRVQSVWKLWLY